MKPKAALSLIKDSVNYWTQDKVPIHAAALSYYTVFSIAPLLIITIAVAALVFGAEAARGEITTAMQGLVGQSGAHAIEDMIKGASQQGKGSGIVATVIGIGALLFGASGVFTQLQTSLNMIWNVEPKPRNSFLQAIKDRFLSFAMVLVVGFLLLVSLALSAALGALGGFLSSRLPGGEGMWKALNFVISFGVISSLFAMMYKYLPDAKIRWQDVWVGATATAFLFTVGKFAIGAYLGNSAFSSSYGAAGSVLILLTWVFYSSMILFFGAEFTRVYSEHFGRKILPSDGARKSGATPKQLESAGVRSSAHGPAGSGKKSQASISDAFSGDEGEKNSPWRKATSSLGMTAAQVGENSNVLRFDTAARARKKPHTGGYPFFSSVAAVLIGLGASVGMKVARAKSKAKDQKPDKAI
ncbi:MAG: YihY/virulence factor BrkB family protein [Methylotenera sp.]|nr:YihY/virulence factor BrkB family protein [Oligoflexia bacterium]